MASTLFLRFSLIFILLLAVHSDDIIKTRTEKDSSSEVVKQGHASNLQEIGSMSLIFSSITFSLFCFPFLCIFFYFLTDVLRKHRETCGTQKSTETLH